MRFSSSSALRVVRGRSTAIGVCFVSAIVAAVPSGCGGDVNDGKRGNVGDGRDAGTGGGADEGQGGGFSGGGPLWPGGAGGAGGYYPNSCFLGGTLIATPKGDVPIESLKIGDAVYGYDELAHGVVEETVSATFVHHGSPVGTLALADGRELRVTDEHPIYLADRDGYVPASEVGGDERLLGIDGRHRTLSAVSHGFTANVLASETVYNITVDRVHNYFAEGVLVHNKSGGRPIGGAGGGWCMAPVESFSECVTPTGKCVDPAVPQDEHVPKYPTGTGGAPPVYDAGGPPPHDAGAPLPSDAGRPPPYEGGSFGYEAGDDGAANVPPRPDLLARQLCQRNLGESFDAFVAFDALGATPANSFTVARMHDECSGTVLGHVGFYSWDAPPQGEWRTLCVKVPAGELHDVLAVSAEPGILIDDLRVVSSCDCWRELQLPCQMATGGAACSVL